MKSWKWATVFALIFVGLIVAANVLTSRYGIVAGMVPAGTFAAGLTFAVRDLLQRFGGGWWALAAVAVGAGMSVWLSSPALALASGVAFAVSELLDFAVYTPLRRGSAPVAMLLSNTVGAAADSLLFLWLAGFLLALWDTQTLIKVAVTLPVVAVFVVVRRRSAVA